MSKNKQGDRNARLGRYAQSLFNTTLALSGLTLTSPTPDLNSFDFVLEQLPSINIHGPGLDRAAEHLKLELQMKGTATIKPSIRIALSSLNILAKSGRPAVIGIMHFENTTSAQPKCLGFYVVHLLDDRLAAALKALRRNGIEEKVATNKAEVTITAKKSELVPLETAAIVAAFHRICGPSMAEYAARKRKQVDEGWYPKTGRYKFNASLEIPWDQAVEGLLGLRPFDVQRLEQWETRFDLDELIGSGPAKITLNLRPIASGTLTAVLNEQRCLIPADLYMLPIAVPSIHQKWVFRCGGYEFIAMSNRWHVRDLEPRPALTASGWADELRFIELIYQVGARISFTANGHAPYFWNRDAAGSSAVIGDIERKRLFMEAVCVLAESAGTQSDTLDIDALVAQQHSIMTIGQVIAGQGRLNLKCDFDDPNDAREETSILAFWADINRRRVAFAFRAELKITGTTCDLASAELLDSCPISTEAPDEFERFFERVRKLSGIPTVVALLPKDNVPLPLEWPLGGTGDQIEFRLYLNDQQL